MCSCLKHCGAVMILSSYLVYQLLAMPYARGGTTRYFD